MGWNRFVMAPRAGALAHCVVRVVTLVLSRSSAKIAGRFLFTCFGNRPNRFWERFRCGNRRCFVLTASTGLGHTHFFWGDFFLRTMSGLFELCLICKQRLHGCVARVNSLSWRSCPVSYPESRPKLAWIVGKVTDVKGTRPMKPTEQVLRAFPVCCLSLFWYDGQYGFGTCTFFGGTLLLLTDHVGFIWTVSKLAFYFF